jgi:hypothetical protein
MSYLTPKWKITVRPDIAAAVEERLFDPSLGKPRYGARAALINELLERWLREQEEMEAAAKDGPILPIEADEIIKAEEPTDND